MNSANIAGDTPTVSWLSPKPHMSHGRTRPAAAKSGCGSSRVQPKPPEPTYVPSLFRLNSPFCSRVVQLRQVAVAQEGHHAMQRLRLIHHVVHDLGQAAQVDQGPGHAQGPPPRGFEPHVEDVAQGIVRQGQQARRGRFIYRDIGEMELVEVGVGLERRLPAVGAAVFAADPGLVHAPVALGVDVAHVEVRLDHPVVAHLRAPENLFAQPHLPAARQLAFASQVGGRDDLVPAVLRVAEDERPGGLQRVVAIPQVALLRLDGPGGQLRHLARQPAQHRPIGRR